LDDFSAKLEKEHQFQPLGELVHSFTTNTKAASAAGSMNGNARSHQNGDISVSKTYEIYSCESSFPKFQDYLQKMETFILWFIDAATFVDSDDERWKFFVM